MGDDRQRPDRTSPTGRFDDDEATQLRPGFGDLPGRGDLDETRVRPPGSGGALDETRLRPAGPGGSADGTRMMPAASDEQPRWEARAAVPPAGAVPAPAGYEYYDEPVTPPPDDRNWLRPLLFGVIGLVLLGVLLTGIWLIFTADDEPAPQVSATAAPPSAPAPTTQTTPPATSAPPSSAEPEIVVVPDDLIGLTESEARQRLTDAGLRVQVVRREDATMAPGTVIEAEPGPGSQVDENSVVRIVVATAPRPSPPRSSQTGGNG